MNDRPTGYVGVAEFTQAMQTRLAAARETQEHFLLMGNVAAAINWGREIDVVRDLMVREADRLEWFALQSFGSLAARPCLEHARRLKEIAG